MESNVTSTDGSRAYGVGTRTDVGSRRTRNEDFFSVAETKHGLLVVVCDGMGGHAGGERASRLAVQEFNAAIDANDDDARAMFERAVARANEAVYRESTQNADTAGMGTTLVAALVRAGRALVVNVGDSRAYRWHANRLERISLDHSVVEELVAAGRITAEQARVHPQRNIITRALGTSASVQPDLFEVEIGPGDGLLLATDGLHGMIADDVIEDILRRRALPDAACDELVAAALAAGGDDNVTVALVRSGEDAAIAAASATTDPVRAGDAPRTRRNGAAWLWVVLTLAAAATAWVLLVARPWERADNLAPTNPTPTIAIDTTLSGLDSILLDSTAQATPYDLLRGDSVRATMPIDTLLGSDSAAYRARDTAPRGDVVTGRR